MKKKMGVFVFGSTVFITLYLFITSVMSNKNNIPTYLSSFALAEINGNIYSDKQINTLKPTVIIIVSADCGTCNALLDNFVDTKIDSINLIIITFDKESAIKISNRISNKNIKILISESKYLTEKFGNAVISSVFIYNLHKKLIKHYVGSVNPMKFI